MEGARIAVIEDMPGSQKVVARTARIAGHEVVATANDLPQAIELSEKIVGGELEVDVVVLDGNLSPDFGGGADARHVMRLLGYHNPEMIGYDGSDEQTIVPVIGYSALSFREYGLTPACDAGKSDLATAGMEFIANL